jgi:beta-fructofuranosidase
MRQNVVLPLIVLLLVPLDTLLAAEADLPVHSSAKLLWRIGEPKPGAVPPVAKAMTLAVRLKDVKSSGELVSWNGTSGRVAVRMLIGEVKSRQALIAEFATSAKPNPLRLSVPLDVLGADVPHDIVLRYLGYRLELFADGVLVDEEWPFGSVPIAQGPMNLTSASIAQVALWDRDLKDIELQSLSGGPAALAERENRYLGPPSLVGQYWRPRGINTSAGDCMPFFHDGRFHLFYLFDRRHHGSKWGLGAHQWAHVSTTDLVHWEEHPRAVAITDEKEGSICTGSTFFNDGTYYAFYAVRTTDGSPAQLCAATGMDGVHFTKHPPLATLKPPYQPGPSRDPVVFHDATTGLFHMLVTTELSDPTVAGRGGCLAQLVSRDLKQWEQREPFIVPGYPGQPECADYFEWHGWYYLVFSNQGTARYRMSRHPLGPWLRPKVDVFDGPEASVMKTAAFTGDRRLGVAFLSAGGYAGDVVFREIDQNPDGTLATKWPAEMIPAAGASQDLPTVKVAAPQGLEVFPLGKVPRDFLLRARVTPEADASYFGIRFRAGEKMQGGFELRFEPRREKAGLRPADAGSWDECEDKSIYDVTGLDHPFDLELLVKGDVVDVCIDHRRTLVARMSAADANLFAFAQSAEVKFEKLELQPLAPPQME